MKRFFCVIFVLLYVCIFTFCTAKNTREDCLSYQEKAFEGEFEVILKDITFSVAVRGDEWSPVNGKARNITVEFTSPESLRGIIITKNSEKTSVSLDGITFECDGMTYASLADFTRLLELTAAPTDFRIEEENTRATFAGVNGETISLLLGKNGIPLEISDNKTTIKIISYKAIEQ
ncbi:MAG: hypothetical protein IJZ89_00375 [Clostridia bacterium]|nr:hypothetical protein [Clostridia bacterium]